MTGVVSRFAPSPTGKLHLGHAASAIRAHDFARDRGGRFLLRIEDIDEGRVRTEFVEAIEEDLAWLGLSWDGPVRMQSTRRAAYDDALGQLIDQGVAYPCFCTRKDIAAAVAAPHGPDGPLYPGTCRALPAEVRRQRAATEPHAWRLDIGEAEKRIGALSFVDKGARQAVIPDLLGDVVIARKDAGTSYHLACCVDDADQGVTDVVRGVDLAPSTHVHRVLQALLGFAAPAYHHHPLVMGADGARLAKRNGAKSLADLRAGGLTPSGIRRQLSL